ncbi:phosphate acetyltransferase [Acidihalobacter aeolianus]|uniref:Phosphate acetyltransferase n=1 Tax=Acidihalobacter aeolianus TaxID=2792603 RepID=A0A1D8K770_9GAMM|nr:bifunctional enoyl-CoA hydratase/phosphate acetyltransferase [Acidihalobacter aeolianus]AOV16813.1 phosphate acetyltransferase [Acidihalobacter aeolianus]
MPNDIRQLDDFIREAKQIDPAPTAVVDASERHVLEAAISAAREGLIEPLLIGQRSIIEPMCEELGCDHPILDAHSPEEAAEAGVEEAKAGRVKLLMKGHLHTAEFLHPIIKELRTSERISHVFAAELDRYPKLLYITDAAINITPDLATKAQILQNAVDLVRLFGTDRPKAAALSAIEVVNPAVTSTIDAACLAKMSERGQIRNAIVDGPLAFDNAISSESASIKGIESPVAGDVDILLAPDLVSGNILYKDLEYLAGARFAGIVLGATIPIVLTSRSDPEAVRLASLSLARVAHHRRDLQA